MAEGSAWLLNLADFDLLFELKVEGHGELRALVAALTALSSWCPSANSGWDSWQFLVSLAQRDAFNKSLTGVENFRLSGWVISSSMDYLPELSCRVNQAANTPAANPKKCPVQLTPGNTTNKENKAHP